LRYIKSAVLAIAVLLLAGVLAPPAHAQVSFDLAYSNLSQHGSWLVSAQYGHVWQPREYNRGWNPYYDGHWIYTDMGWAWVSDYSWGAIPYHYGTWVADPAAGWVWIPGNVWAPSWVVFRTDSSYIGWAPVPPGFSVGMSIDMGNSSNFVFVSSRNFLVPRVRMSIIPMDQTRVFINNTTVVNNIVVQNNVVVNRGPDYRTVERATGRNIREQRIESVTRVAPFDHVSRAQLAVDPERVKSGVRVAEPVPASQPLPGPGNHGNKGRSTSPAEATKPSNGHPSAQPNPREPTNPPTTVTPSGAAVDGQKSHRVQTPPSGDPALPSSTEARTKAHADQNGQDRGNSKAKPDQGAIDQANVKAQQNAEAQANAKAKAGQDAKNQANAKAQQNAKAQANAKKQAEANAKKHVPPDKPAKQDQTTDKDTTPGTKEEPPK
jgi:uncharacterized protein DUF6600